MGVLRLLKGNTRAKQAENLISRGQFSKLGPLHDTLVAYFLAKQKFSKKL